jgi:hypothetical protein
VEKDIRGKRRKGKMRIDEGKDVREKDVSE